MKNAIFKWIFILLFSAMICPSLTVYAENDENTAFIDTDELYESLGIDSDEIYDNIPEESIDTINDTGISLSDTSGFTHISPSELIGYIIDKFRDDLTEPVRLLSSIIAIAAISAAASFLPDSVSGKDDIGMAGTVAALASAAAAAVPIGSCISQISATITAGSRFMAAYIPVFVGIAASSGSVTSAAAYDLAVEGFAEISVQIAARVVIPLLSVCTALSITDGIDDSFGLSAVTKLAQKLTGVALTGAVTIFSGLLSLQSAVGTSADSLGAKTAKLAVANFVPVVGGALSDTCAAVRSGLALLKNAAGIFGIIVISAAILPPLLRSVGLYLALCIGSTAADIGGCKRMAALLRNLSSVMGMAMAITLCFGAVFIISTAILMAQKVQF